MNEMINRTGTTLPANFIDKLASGIAESRAKTILPGGGKPYLRLLKNEQWVWGPSNEEMQAGSRWVINIFSLAHGWDCWIDSEMRGEVMASMADPKPDCPPPIDDVAYKEKRSFELRCLDGDDAGTEVLYKCNSLSGIRAIDGLLAQIQRQLASPQGKLHPCPVIIFGSDWYDHPKHGRTTTPIYNLVGWSDMDGNLADATPAAPPAPPPATAAAKPAKPVLKPVEPVSTTQTHTGQRRRPAAR